MPTADLGYAAKFAIGAAGGAATVQLDFVSETLKAQETLTNFTGLRGTVAHAASRTRAVQRRVAGTVSLQPNPVEMAAIFKYIFGGTPSGTSYPLAETLPAFVAVIVRGLKMFTYDNCLISRATFRSAPFGPVELMLDIMGVDEVVAASSGFPSLSLDNTTLPFIFSDSTGALTINSVTCDQFAWSLEIDNRVQQRAANSITPTLAYRTDRIITWSFDTPYGDAEALYSLSSAGVAVSAVFTNGTVSLSLVSPKVAFVRDAPSVPGRDEIHLPLVGTAGFNSAAGDEIVVTLDSSV